MEKRAATGSDGSRNLTEHNELYVSDCFYTRYSMSVIKKQQLIHKCSFFVKSLLQCHKLVLYLSSISNCYNNVVTRSNLQ
jgi:hypothetical protein